MTAPDNKKDSGDGGQETIADLESVAGLDPALQGLGTENAMPTTWWARIQENLVGGLAAVALFISALNILLRTISPRLTLELSDEVQVYLVVWAILLGLGLVTFTDRHIKADLFVSKFSPRFRCLALGLAEVLGLVFALALVWVGFLITYEAWDFGDVSSTNLRFPLWIYIASLPVGALLMAIAYARRLIRMF